MKGDHVLESDEWPSQLDFIINRMDRIQEAAEKYIPPEAWREELAQHHNIPQMCESVRRRCRALLRLAASPREEGTE